MTMSLNVVKENWIKLKKGQSIVIVIEKVKFSVMLQKIAMLVISNKKVAHEFELCHENVIWQFWTLVKVGSIGKKDATISNARIFISACCLLLYVILFDELHTKKSESRRHNILLVAHIFFCFSLINAQLATKLKKFQGRIVVNCLISNR